MPCETCGDTDDTWAGECHDCFEATAALTFWQTFEPEEEAAKAAGGEPCP